MDNNYYLHINEWFSLELCTYNELIDNHLTGRVIYSGLHRLDPIESSDLVHEYARIYSCNFVITSIDPFLLNDFHFKILSKLTIAKGLIICDTHHGFQPLTRIFKLVEICGVRSVLLRFNQRHERLFHHVGCWAGTTVLSPDLHHSLVSTQEFDNCPNNPLNPGGVFVGGSGTPGTRRHDIIKAIDKSNSSNVRRLTTRDKWHMFDVLSQYSYSVNIPLNGDFNRDSLDLCCK